MNSASLLLLDDEPAIRFAYAKYLSRIGFQIQEASTLGEARNLIASKRYDAVLLDLSLPDGNGLDWLAELREFYPDLAIVVITGVGDIPSAVEAMRRGADHFLTKPVNMSDLEVFLLKSLEVGTLRKRNSAQRRLSKIQKPFIGTSPAILRTDSLLTLASESDSNVLIQGETGTGKGVFARWIHFNGKRGGMHFVEVNCSSLRGEMLSTELFGHVRGAFTSAVESRQGLLDVADGGTLFLDEIGDMDLGIQSQFLKVLDEKSYRRVGDVQQRKSDFRLICATNKDLLAESQAGRFRKDLFFRINVLVVEVPPLRERMEDFHELTMNLLQTLGAENLEIGEEVQEILRRYSWPGNIRELRNVLERAILLGGKKGQLMPHHLPALGLGPVESAPILDPSGQAEAARILEVLRQSNGDKKKAAEGLGISRATLYRRLKELKL